MKNLIWDFFLQLSNKSIGNKIVQLCLNSQIGMTFKLCQSRVSNALMFWQLHLIYYIRHVSMGKTHHLLNIKSSLLEINLSDVALCINLPIYLTRCGLTTKHMVLWTQIAKTSSTVETLRKWRTHWKNRGEGVSVQNHKLGITKMCKIHHLIHLLNSVVSFLTN